MNDKNQETNKSEYKKLVITYSIATLLTSCLMMFFLTEIDNSFEFFIKILYYGCITFLIMFFLLLIGILMEMTTHKDVNNQ